MSGPMGTKKGRLRIGDLLKGDGILSEPALERGLATQRKTGREIRLGSVLVGLGVVSEEALLGALARAHGCPAVGFPELSAADPAAVALLSSARAYRLGAIPFALEKKTVRVAFLDPSDIAAHDEVAAVTGLRVQTAVTSELRLMQAHEKFYGRPISRHFGNILKRLEMKFDDTIPIQPTPPPPPRFTDEDVAAVDSPDSSSLSEPPASSDPFSDAYSLSDFVADVLDGVSLEALWEAAGGDDEETLDPGEPIPEEEPIFDEEPEEVAEPQVMREPEESFESTRPSRRARESSDDSAGPMELGALA